MISELPFMMSGTTIFADLHERKKRVESSAESYERTSVHGKTVEMIANGEERVLFDMMTYPLTVRLWIEEISGKDSLRFGIHQVDSDRLRSYFLVTGSIPTKEALFSHIVGEVAKALQESTRV